MNKSLRLWIDKYFTKNIYRDDRIIISKLTDNHFKLKATNCLVADILYENNIVFVTVQDDDKHDYFKEYRYCFVYKEESISIDEFIINAMKKNVFFYPSRKEIVKLKSHFESKFYEDIARLEEYDKIYLDDDDDDTIRFLPDFSIREYKKYYHVDFQQKRLISGIDVFKVIRLSHSGTVKNVSRYYGYSNTFFHLDLLSSYIEHINRNKLDFFYTELKDREFGVEGLLTNKVQSIYEFVDPRYIKTLKNGEMHCYFHKKNRSFIVKCLINSDSDLDNHFGEFHDNSDSKSFLTVGYNKGNITKELELNNKQTMLDFQKSMIDIPTIKLMNAIKKNPSDELLEKLKQIDITIDDDNPLSDEMIELVTMIDY